MWFFGCGSRSNGSSTGCSSARYPVTGQSHLAIHSGHGPCPYANLYSDVFRTGNPCAQPYYALRSPATPYYGTMAYTYNAPPPRYVVPQPSTSNRYYGYPSAPPPYVPVSGPRPTTRASQATTKSQVSAASGGRVTDTATSSRRKVTFGRVDVREFSRRGEGGGT